MTRVWRAMPSRPVPFWHRVGSLVLMGATFASAPRGLLGDAIHKEDSEMGITIMGAIVQKHSDDNVALIKEDSGTVRAVKKDHVISNTYKVLAVKENSLELVTRDGKHMIVHRGKFVTPGAGKSAVAATGINGSADQYREEGFERDKGKIQVSASFRDKLVKEDLARILMQATAEPYMEGGAIVGFKLSQIDDGSIYAKSGVVNGDIITAINGTELNNVASAVSLLHSLKAADHIDIDLRRNGGTQKITVDVR